VVGEFIGDEQRRRDRAHAKLRADLESLLAQLREANTVRKSQTEKLFIQFAKLSGDVAELRRMTNDINRRGREVIVQSPPLRRLDG
jgi:hypothetical protein